MGTNLGASAYGAFANKCWPAFEKYFGLVPCYLNSRLAARGVPVACEADIYGALSEYMAVCATQMPPAILDINNTVPKDMYEESRDRIGDRPLTDLWMGFHCGNTSSGCLVQPMMQHQLIMHRMMEPGAEPNITRGTLEGQIRSGPVSIFRLQATPEALLRAYMANGEVLDIDPKSFGSIGVFAVKEMGRFYRHVLIEKRFPHHTAVAFAHAGRTLFSACAMLGVKELFYQPAPGGSVSVGESLLTRCVDSSCGPSYLYRSDRFRMKEVFHVWMMRISRRWANSSAVGRGPNPGRSRWSNRFA